MLPAAAVAPVPKPKGRGRPPGSKSVRDSLNKHEFQQLQLQQQQQQLKPGSIEYARAHIDKNKAAPTQSPRADNKLSVLSKLPLALLSCVGSMVQHVCFATFKHAMDNAIDETDTIVTACLAGTSHTMSASSVTDTMDNSSQHGSNFSARSLLLQTGSAVIEFGGWLWSVFASHILSLCKPSWRPVLILLKLRYDETPSRVRVVTTDAGELLMIPAYLKNGRFQDPDFERYLQQEQSCHHAKVLQTEYRVGMLYHNVTEDQFMWYCSTIPTCLQVTDRTTGERAREMIWDTINLVPELPRIADAFEIQLRHSCTDR